MNTRQTRIAATLALAAAAGWSGTSHACSPESYISEICMMAANYAPQYYLPADGRTVPLRDYIALYTLTGLTYGGNFDKNQLQLPDLRGRFILGAGQRPATADGQPAGPTHTFGQTGGYETVTIGSVNLPPLSVASPVAVTTPPTYAIVDLGNVTDNASTFDVAATTFSAPASGLTLKAAGTAGGGTTAQGNALGTANTPNLKLYVDAVPNVTMRAGSITGTLNGTIPATAGKTAFKGDMSASVPARTATYSYNVLFSNPNQPLDIMPPYQALNYYISVNGYYPPRS